jgi:hypothetical protein
LGWKLLPFTPRICAFRDWHEKHIEVVGLTRDQQAQLAKGLRYSLMPGQTQMPKRVPISVNLGSGVARKVKSGHRRNLQLAFSNMECGGRAQRRHRFANGGSNHPDHSMIKKSKNI